MWPFSRRWDPIDEVLAKADLAFAHARIVETFAGAILKKEMVELLDAFSRRPTTASAKALVNFEPSLLACFVGSQEARRWFEANGLPPTQARKNASTLSGELGFQELVDSIVDDRVRHEELLAAFIASGYSREVINEAIGQYFEDLSY